MTSERTASIALDVAYSERADGTPAIEVVRVGGIAIDMSEPLRLAVVAALVRGGFVGESRASDAVGQEIRRAIG